MKKTTVLIFDANQRSSLAATRSIGSIDDTYVITTDSTQQSLAGSSKYSQKYLQSPPIKERPNDFIDWLSKIVNKYAINLFLPMTEITSQSLLINQSKFPSVELPFSSYKQVMEIANKSKLINHAKELNIPIPASKYYENIHHLNKNSLQYPCVLKPSLSHIFEKNTWISTGVRILNNPDDLQTAIDEDIYLSNHDFLIQEFIPGYGAGIFCFYQKGSPKVFFSHKRIREKPPSGGVSVLSESVIVDEKLKEYASNILNSVNWHGVAMVEFRISPSGQAYLMEINTRFWGSLQLAIDAGVDFPRWVYATQLGKPTPKITPYKTGIKLRWLLGDLDSLYIYLKSPSYRVNQKLSRIITFAFSSLFTCKHEVNRLSDIKPAQYELKTYIKDLLNMN